MTDLLPVEPDALSLEADPVGYSGLVLYRIRELSGEWLTIEDVRHSKSILIGMEEVMRQKEMATDARYNIEEAVRRLDREQGLMVRKGQEEGTIARRGDVGRAGLDGHRGGHLIKPSEVFSGDSERSDSYALADVAAEDFDAAIEEARDEGNLSRANMVRKVKGEKPKAERSEWHHKKRRIDSNRVIERLAGELDAACTGLDLIDPTGLDVEVKLAAVSSIKASIATIQKEMRKW